VCLGGFCSPKHTLSFNQVRKFYQVYVYLVRIL
jgi:hypothetical protein